MYARPSLQANTIFLCPDVPYWLVGAGASGLLRVSVSYISIVGQLTQSVSPRFDSSGWIS